MKKHFQKISALVLAVITLFSLVACSTNETTVETPSSHTTNPVTENSTTDPDYSMDLGDDLNFDTNVTILYVNKSGRSDELACDNLGGGVISDAVFERNAAVEDRLGITFDYVTRNEDTEATAMMSNLVQAGDASVDVFTIGTYVSMAPMLSGHYLNLNELDNINLSKHYWNQDYNEMMTFTSQNLQFVATSPIAISMFRRGYLTIFNRDLLEAYKIPDLYETIDNGDWTLEYQYNMIKDIYTDEDGDSRKSDEDFYGFVVGNVGDMDVYTVASDIHMVIRGEDGALVYNADITDRMIDMSEKVSALCNAAGTYLSDGFGQGFEYPLIKFSEKKALMATTMFGDIELHFESLADMNYGIAPMPKLSREQKDYKTYIQDQVSCFGISSAIDNVERQEQIAAVLEAMSYYSYQIIRPAYYDSVLSLRFMQDPQSREILDTMFESVSFDYVYATGLSGFRDSMRSVLPTTNPALASKLKRWKSQMEKDLEKQQDSFDKLLDQQG